MSDFYLEMEAVHLPIIPGAIAPPVLEKKVENEIGIGTEKENTGTRTGTAHARTLTGTKERGGAPVHS